MSVRDKIAMWNSMGGSDNKSTPVKATPSANNVNKVASTYNNNNTASNNVTSSPSAPTQKEESSKAIITNNTNKVQAEGNAPWAVDGGGIVKPSQMKANGGSPWANNSTSTSNKPSNVPAFKPSPPSQPQQISQPEPVKPKA